MVNSLNIARVFTIIGYVLPIFLISGYFEFEKEKPGFAWVLTFIGFVLSIFPIAGHFVFDKANQNCGAAVLAFKR